MSAGGFKGLDEVQAEVACVLSDLGAPPREGDVYMLVSSEYMRRLRAFATREISETGDPGVHGFTEVIHTTRVVRTNMREKADFEAIPAAAFERLAKALPGLEKARVPRRAMAAAGGGGAAAIDFNPCLCLVAGRGDGRQPVLVERCLTFEQMVARLEAAGVRWEGECAAAAVSAVSVTGVPSKLFRKGKGHLQDCIPPGAVAVVLQPVPRAGAPLARDVPPLSSLAAPVGSVAVVDLSIDDEEPEVALVRHHRRGGPPASAASPPREAAAAPEAAEVPLRVKVGDVIDVMHNHSWSRSIVTAVDGDGIQATPLQRLNNNWIRNTADTVAIAGTRDTLYTPPAQPRLGPGAVGMDNLGNTCFMSSMLQCLGAIEPLVRHLLDPGLVNALAPDTEAADSREVPRLLRDLLRQMWRDTWNGALDYRKLKAAFCRHESNVALDGGGQHDSQEFYQLFLDDIVRVLKAPPACATGKWIEELFGVGLRDEKRCAECKKKVPVDAPQTLSLGVPFPPAEVLFFPADGPAVPLQVPAGIKVPCLLRTVEERMLIPASSLVCVKCCKVASHLQPGHVDTTSNYDVVSYDERYLVVALDLGAKPVVDAGAPPAKKPRTDGSPAVGATVPDTKSDEFALTPPTSVSCKSLYDLWQEQIVLVHVMSSTSKPGASFPSAANFVSIMAVKVAVASSCSYYPAEPAVSDVFTSVVAAVGTRLEGSTDIAVFAADHHDGRVPRVLLAENSSRLYSWTYVFVVIPEKAARAAYGPVPDLPELNCPSAGHVGALSLERCISAMLSEEELRQDNLWHCPKCDRKVKSFQTVHVVRAPRVLAVHLKRFAYNAASKSRHKIDTRVVFPVRGLVLCENVYDLIAVSIHCGRLDYGHYTALTRNFLDSKWYRTDDAAVTVCSERDLEDKTLQCEAYVLFYIAREYKSPGGVPGEMAV